MGNMYTQLVFGSGKGVMHTKTLDKPIHTRRLVAVFYRDNKVDRIIVTPCSDIYVVQLVQHEEDKDGW